MQPNIVRYIEGYSYDGDIDNDSFKSAVCEMYIGFQHTIPAEIFSSQMVEDDAEEASFNSDIFEGHDDFVLPDPDEGTTVSSDIFLDDLLSMNDECDIVTYPPCHESNNLSHYSDVNLSYDTDIMLDENIAKEFMMLPTIGGQDMQLRKLGALSHKLTTCFDNPLNNEANGISYFSHKPVGIPDKHLKNIMYNTQEYPFYLCREMLI